MGDDGEREHDSSRRAKRPCYDLSAHDMCYFLLTSTGMGGKKQPKG